MRAAAAVRAGPVEPSVYLTSGRKEYLVDYPWQFTLQTAPSNISAIKSDGSSIGERLRDDKFFLGNFLLKETDENVYFCQPFFLFEVRCCCSAAMNTKCWE
jgi:hypothetical protein